MSVRHPPRRDERVPYLPAGLTFLTKEGSWEMSPAQLRAIRMDMGINMTAMALLLEEETGARISRDKYRTWEKPRRKNEWGLVPAYVAEAVERSYSAFLDFISTLVAMYDGNDPLVLIHRNDMFDEADLPLPAHVYVHNYNQAVGKAWAEIRPQGFNPELVYFSTDMSPEVIPRTSQPSSQPSTISTSPPGSSTNAPNEM